MKFGVREICNVTLRAKAPVTFGNKKFYAGEPVFHFDTLKTSSLEGASSTVYAQGGRGNPRLVGWEGDRTLTFTMEDALASPETLTLLTGGKMIQGTEEVHEYVEMHKEVSYQRKKITQTVVGGQTITSKRQNFVPFIIYQNELTVGNIIPKVKKSDYFGVNVFLEGEEEPYVVYEDAIGKPGNWKTAEEYYGLFPLITNSTQYTIPDGATVLNDLFLLLETKLNTQNVFAKYLGAIKVRLNDRKIIETIEYHRFHNGEGNNKGKGNFNNNVPTGSGTTIMELTNLYGGTDLSEPEKENLFKKELKDKINSVILLSTLYSKVNNGQVKCYTKNNDNVWAEDPNLVYNFISPGVADDEDALPGEEGDPLFVSAVDFYYDKDVTCIEIGPEIENYNFYLEAETLYRDTATGLDYPMTFVIPNCRVQPNFTLSMANSGDSSTFTFTLDAFPDYTKFDGSKKVLAAMQLIEDNDININESRVSTPHSVG